MFPMREQEWALTNVIERTAENGSKPKLKMAPRRPLAAEQSPQRAQPKAQSSNKSPDASRKNLLQTFGNVVAFLVDVPRYRNHSIGDLQFIILEALVRDRVQLVIHSNPASGSDPAVSAVAIWASVSENVDVKIREQIRAGVFPVRLMPDDWTSGKINWLLDIVSQSPDVAKHVVAGFGQVTKGDNLNLHPSVSAMMDAETLKKLGAKVIAPQLTSRT